MLRLLKWIYNLGVNHERARITNYLTTIQTERTNFLSQKIIEKEETDKQLIFEKEVKRAVDRDIINIIDVIFRSEERYVRGESVMYLKRESK